MTMRTRRRLQRLERRAATLPDEGSLENALAAWCRSGCRGPLPSAGPRSAKYTPEEWEANHRFFLALCCRSLGKPDPPELTGSERREVDETMALFDSVGLRGVLSLRQQADLASDAGVLVQWLTDTGGGTVPPEYARGGLS